MVLKNISYSCKYNQRFYERRHNLNHPFRDGLIIRDFMRLKEIRKSKGISQLKLAMDLNTNQNTISRYETGEREPGINELIKIADYFNISIDYLLERTDNPKIQK